MPRRWKCTVCGYIHEGEEPPENCPVCGADRSKFIPIEAEEVSLLQELVSNFHLHSVAAHFPGGLVPTSALFLLLYFGTGHTGLEMTVFWLLLVVVSIIPVSLASGIYSWQKHFGGQRASIFFKKIGLALTLLLLGLVAIVLRYGQPELLVTGGWRCWLYLLCLGGMLGCVVLLGHYGSKLVFQWHGQNHKYSKNRRIYGKQRT
jgi:rubredoxin